MSAIPASIPAPQAVVELINSHCPPGFSVSRVGASVSLFRGASKTPLAAFSYTGPDSVIGIVVAIWRIALAGQADRSVTPKYADPNTVNIEEMKARGDALEILGWPGACDPTVWARSYLNIEQVTLADERERAAQAESRIRVLESEATALRDSEQRAVDASIEARAALKSLGWDGVQHPIRVWARQRADSLAKGLREAREAAEQGTTRIVELSAEVGTVQAQNKALLAALWKLGYHPDMNLDEWADARVKQRGETEAKLAVAHKALSILGWIPLLFCEPVPWAESKRAEIDGPASMNRRAEIEEAVDWCFTNPGRGLAAELANDAAKALQEKLAASAPEATTLRWAMAQAMHIGAQTAIRWAETEDRRLRRAPGADEALAAETATAALRKEALVVLGWDGMGDPKAWAAGQQGKLDGARQEARVAVDQNVRIVRALRTLGYRPQDWTTVEEWAVVTHEWHKQGIRPPESETLATIRGALEEALGLAENRPIIELVEKLAAQRDKIRAECGLLEKTSTGITICHDTAYVYSGRWARCCKALGFNPDAEPPTDIAAARDMDTQRLRDNLAWFVVRHGMHDLREVRQWSDYKLACAAKAVRDLMDLRAGAKETKSADRPVDKDAAREPSPRTRWMAFQDAAVALGLSTHIGPDGGVVVTSPSRFAKPATIGVRLALDPGEGVDVARVLNTPIEPRRVVGVDHATGESVTCMRVSLPGGTQVRYLIHDGKEWVEAPARAEPAKTVQTPLFVADGDSRFKIADARCWKRGDTEAQDRVGRAWVSTISGSCAGMTGLPFKPGPAVRFVDADDKLVLAGKVIRYESKNITGGRLGWEAEVLHEVELSLRDLEARDVTAGGINHWAPKPKVAAPKVTDEQRQSSCFIVGDKVVAGPRWTGITWMSAKGRAKTCRIEGLTFSVSKLASADPAPTVIKVPTSPWNLPAKLVRRIHGKKTLSFHVGGGKVITGTVAKVDASAISSMLLYVAT